MAPEHTVTRLNRLMLRPALLTMIALMALPHPAVAQEARPQQGLETSALINQQLDAVVNLELRNRPLPEVLQQIRETANVPFVVTDETWALLPWGRETPITANVRGTPLRQTLNAITSRLGLTYVLRSEHVEIRPLPALQRTGRRATVQEIAGLDLLSEARLDLLEERPNVGQALEAIDLVLQQLDTRARETGAPEPGFKVENRLDETMREQPVFIRRNATLLQALEAVADQTRATWYPWGDSFIVLPRETWIRQRLDDPVELIDTQLDVHQALLELERAAGVPFSIEPGAVQRVPERYRRVSLSLRRATVRSALESLGAVTGLSYIVTDSGVHIRHRDSTTPVPNGQPAAAPAEQPVLLVDLGNGASLLVYPSELPEDLRRQLQAQRDAALQRLRETLGEQEPQN